MRRNTVACLALFVALGGTAAYAANTVGSLDIIDEAILSVDLKDGEVKSSDVASNAIASSKMLNGSVINAKLGASAVTSDKVLDNTLTGADIKESSLGKVGDANTVDGLDSTELQGQQGPTGPPGPQGPAAFVEVQQGGNFTDECTTPNQWRECAPVTVNVPANRTYRVMIDSAGSFRASGATATNVQICSSVRNSATAFDGTGETVAGCPNIATGVTLGADELKNAATNGVQTLSGGDSGASYVVSTATHTDQVLIFPSFFDHGVSHTLVTVADVSGTASAAARAGKAPKLTRGT